MILSHPCLRDFDIGSGTAPRRSLVFWAEVYHVMSSLQLEEAGGQCYVAQLRVPSISVPPLNHTTCDPDLQCLSVPFHMV